MFRHFSPDNVLYGRTLTLSRSLIPSSWWILLWGPPVDRGRTLWPPWPRERQRPFRACGARTHWPSALRRPLRSADVSREGPHTTPDTVTHRQPAFATSRRARSSARSLSEHRPNRTLAAGSPYPRQGPEPMWEGLCGPIQRAKPPLACGHSAGKRLQRKQRKNKQMAVDRRL